MPNSGIAMNTGAQKHRGEQPEHEAHNRQRAERAVVWRPVEIVGMECRLADGVGVVISTCQIQGVSRLLPVIAMPCVSGGMHPPLLSPSTAVDDQARCFLEFLATVP